MTAILSRCTLAILLLALASCGKNQIEDVPTSEMKGIREDFLNPPENTRPGCYWYWINDNISKEGITKDLEAMARVGIGRAYIGHIYNYQAPVAGQPINSGYTPLGNVKFMTDAWWEAVQWAVEEAGRLGVEIGFFNSPGWSQSGGPWIKPSQSMRYITHSETLIKGGKEIDQLIPVPEIKTYPNAGGSRPVQTGPKFTEKDFQDVKLIAFRQNEIEENDFIMESAENIDDAENLLDNSDETFAYLSAGSDNSLIFKLPEMNENEIGVQSVTIKPLDFGYLLRCKIEGSDNGIVYSEIADFTEQRGHQGPKNKDPILIPFRESRSKYIRLTLNVSKTIRISELSLSRQAVLGGYVRKQLGETSPSTNPPWDAYQWDEQTEPAGGSALLSGEILDISDKMDAKGRLKWNAPEGNWVVLRMGMVPTGTQNAPSSPESRGLEVDKMNKEHVHSLFEGMVGKFLEKTPEQKRQALKYVIADSYETGPQNWTDGFLERFESQLGYAPERYLPVLTGRVVDDPEISDRFLWDMRKLIVESVAYDYVGGLREICNENDLTLWLENYGHWGYPSEFLLYGSQTDQVGGEFWIGGVSDNIECRAAVSSAHTYGKKSVYAESFTSGQNFRESPSTLKKWCDWVYAVGVNHLIIHVYIHQPDERKPGIIQWFGTDFNRHNTWFDQSRAFIDYMRRSSVLLKAGLPAVDIAFYVGEDGPMMQGPGNPGLPDGYNFDFINSDALINRTSVKDGRITISDGPSYSILVLPDQNHMRPEVARSISRLVKNGACILGPKPIKSPSLENYPDCDEDLAKIVNELWGNVDGKEVMQGTFGRGKVFDGLPLAEVLKKLDVQKDVEIIGNNEIRCAAAGSGNLGIGGNGGIVFNHRKGDEKDIYFLANTTEKAVDFTASLRSTGKSPSLWNAVNGTIDEDIAFKQEKDRTNIPLHLGPSESIFIVLDENNGNVREAEEIKKSNIHEKTLISPWKVSFEKIDKPEQYIFDELLSWSDHADTAIKYYSGPASYQNSFIVENHEDTNRTLIELGEVGVIASIFVNGKEAGTVWTYPWELDISNYIVKGPNDLIIKVSNTWNNRVYADSQLPEEERTSYISQSYNFMANGDSLHKAGLIGPVLIKKMKR